MFTLINYILSWLKLELFISIIILVVDIFAIRKYNLIPKIEKKFIKPLILVIFLSILFSITMLITGKFGESIVYRGDDLWHLALINELKVNFPPDNPGFSEIPLRGYHFFYNFFAAKTSNLFFISPIRLHFTFLPVFIAFLWGIGVFALLVLWSKKISVALWGVFLTMFGGSFAYILHLQGHTEISLNSGFGMNQPYGSLYNPPFSFSIVLIILALICLYNYILIKQKNWLIPLTLCIGLISMFKVYAGMILIGAFIVFAFLELYRKKYIIILSFAGIFILFFGTFWLFAGGTGFLIYYPLWPPHRILQSYAWYGYDEKIYTYTRMNVIKGLLQTELDGLNVFIFGNLGTRLFGVLLLIFTFVKKRIYPSEFALIVLVMGAISMLIPMFFIQSGKVFEMIQMTHYFLFFSALCASFGFYYLFSLSFPKILKLVIFFAIILLTIPSALSDIPEYYKTFKTLQPLSSSYFQTMNFLSKQNDYNSTVLEIPPEWFRATNKGINSWYNSSNPAIVAFSNKRSFLSNQYIDFPGVDKEKRLDFIKNMIIFTITPATSSAYLDRKEKIIKQLRDNNIHFIFSSYEVLSFADIPKIKKIYKNSPYVIYKIY